MKTPLTDADLITLAQHWQALRHAAQAMDAIARETMDSKERLGPCVTGAVFYAERIHYQLAVLAKKNGWNETQMRMLDANLDTLLTTAETSALTGLSVSTLASWRRRDQPPIQPTRIGRTVRYRLADVLALIQGAQA